MYIFPGVSFFIQHRGSVVQRRLNIFGQNTAVRRFYNGEYKMRLYNSTLHISFIGRNICVTKIMRWHNQPQVTSYRTKRKSYRKKLHLSCITAFFGKNFEPKTNKKEKFLCYLLEFSLFYYTIVVNSTRKLINLWSVEQKGKCPKIKVCPQERTADRNHKSQTPSIYTHNG